MLKSFRVPKLVTLSLTTATQGNHSDKIKVGKEITVKSRKKVEAKKDKKTRRLRII
jgi:hypothetical protein